MDVSEVAPPPPLTRWQSTWRYLFAVIFGVGVSGGTFADQYNGDFGALFAVDLLMGAGSVVLMRWRRRYPMAVALAVNALGVLSTAGAGAAVVTTVSLATRRRWREILPVAAVAVLASLIYFPIHPGSDEYLLALGFTAVFVTAVTATGMYVGARRDLVATLRERAERAGRGGRSRRGYPGANSSAAVAGGTQVAAGMGAAVVVTAVARAAAGRGLRRAR